MDEIEALTREQLIAVLSESASDELLRWIVMDAVVSPIRVSFRRAFGRCDLLKCGKMALYSANAGKGGYPSRCAAHKAKTDTGVPFAIELDRLSQGMGSFKPLSEGGRY